MQDSLHCLQISLETEKITIESCSNEEPSSPHPQRAAISEEEDMEEDILTADTASVGSDQEASSVAVQSSSSDSVAVRYGKEEKKFIPDLPLGSEV